MALGGGKFTSQNKILPGSYINFVSAAHANAALSDRGVAAAPVPLSWGAELEMITITAEDFRRDGQVVFGFPYGAPEMRSLRELFANVREAHIFRVDSGGQIAACGLAKAKHSGLCGNKITVVVEENETSTAEAPLFDIYTLFNNVRVDAQRAVATTAALADNPYLAWTREATLAPTAGMPLSGGTDGTISGENYQKFLDALESHSFNVFGVATTDDTVKALCANWTRRMRDEVGVKVQCVLYRYAKADFEGVISVENEAEGDTTAAVYWLTGAAAGCPVQKSLTNRVYDGEHTIKAAFTQRQLEDALRAGKLIFHKVGTGVRVLEDINTLTTTTDEKGKDLARNQCVRVLDQIGNDIAALFNDRYLGAVPNDPAGRAGLWSDIVDHHKELARLRAIEDFVPGDVKVDPGTERKVVVVSDAVRPLEAMAQLYMTIIVR